MDPDTDYNKEKNMEDTAGTDSEWLGWTSGEAAASKITVEELDQMVVDYQAKREIYEEAKKAATEKYKDFADAEGKLQEALKAMGKKSYKLEGVGTFTRVMKEVVKTPKDLEDKRKFFSWVQDTYGKDVLDSMVSINHNTLNSFYREEAKKSGDPGFEIPGIESPTSVENVSFRKA